MNKEAFDLFSSKCAADMNFFVGVLYETQRELDVFQPPLDKREKDCILEAVGAIPHEHMGQNLEDLKRFVFTYAIG